MGSDTILSSVKLVIGGIDPLDDYFDNSIIPYINMAFATLYDIGGLTDHYVMTSVTDEWSDVPLIEHTKAYAKAYVGFKTKMLWDPPANSSASKAISTQLEVLEWRINWRYEIKEEDNE